MLKIGVLGTGHLGKIHLKCIGLASESYELLGFFDPNPAVAQQVAADYNTTAFPDMESLIAAVDVVDIVTPTTTHFELAKAVIAAGKHLFIEKPITHTLEEAKILVQLAAEKKVKIQVGHVERFNPAVLALGDMAIAPMFIEAHRLAVFNPRGTDVSVVLDLMIHDLDIILSMVNSHVKEVHASGVAVVSDTVDIANARIVFENTCVANLTASRISMKQMRKIRLFQRDAYISLDLLEKEAQVIRLYDTDVQPPAEGQHFELDTQSGKKTIHLDMPKIEPVNSIKLELETFAESIVQDHRPRVNGEDGMRALELAYQITAAIEAATA
ncbi:MAG: Gfo/Idh/MocA family oxidoreductase [Bacteroidota bacterium]